MVEVIKDYLPVNTLLCTKDGRKCGNALIVGFDHFASFSGMAYHCITDYGSRMCLTRTEIEELFYTKGLCDDDHKHRNMFYSASGYNFNEPREEDYINFDMEDR